MALIQSEHADNVKQKLVKAMSGSNTWANKFTALLTEYNNLSVTDQRNSFIMVGSTILNKMNNAHAYYSSVDMDSGYVYTHFVDLESKVYRIGSMKASDNSITIASKTSETTTSTISLYTLTLE